MAQVCTKQNSLIVINQGTSMISIAKGKTEISLNLQKVLNPFFPLPLMGAEERDHSENGLSDQARRRSGLFLERIRRAVWFLVDFMSTYCNPTFFFSCKGSA